MNLQRSPRTWSRRYSVLTWVFLVASVTAAILELYDFSAVRLPLLSDQDGYLEAAELFTRTGLVESKAPLYSVWLGVFSLLSGNEPWLTFILEKVASLVMLAVGMGWLGYILHSAATGVFLAFWTLNLKYVGIETNGSNTFATIAVVYGIILMLKAPDRWRGPVGALALFAAWQARPEFALVFLLYLGLLAVRWLIGLQRMDLRCWLLAGAAIAIVGVALRIRMSTPPFSSNLAVYCSYAVAYADRFKLGSEFPDPWHAVPQIWSRAFPTISYSLERSPVSLLSDMWRADPLQVAGHLAFNAWRAPRIVAAVLFGFQSRALMAMAIAAYLIYLGVFQGRRVQSPRRLHLPAEVWCAVAGFPLLIPISIVLIPLWRYFIPLLVPSMLLVAVMLPSRIARLRALPVAGPHPSLNETKVVEADSAGITRRG